MSETLLAQASAEALRYRLDGKLGQTNVLRTQLAELRGLLTLEQPAAALANDRAEHIKAEVREAVSQLAAEKD